LLLCIHRFDETEIKDFDNVRLTTAAIEHHVGGFDVTMNQAQRVSLEQRSTDLQQDVNDSFFGLRTVAVDQILQIDAVKKFHRVIEDV
jgi:hypothetical protein